MSIPGKNFFGTIAVMDIPINNSHAFKTPHGASIACRNRNAIENTKTHRAIGFGMMARWANIAKSSDKAAVQDMVNRSDRSASRRQCC
jgi:hypothetical protein